ncbi:MAG: hypothetical protein JRD93_12025, partial [Deltaproteobacteria bacterium]|nr:hypothetical protein [Deltaproteobacteria bacterium]
LQVRGKYRKKYKDDGLWKSQSIYIWGQEEPAESGKWVAGVRKKVKRSQNIFIHPAHFPDDLDGCLALGGYFSDYGFVSYKDSRQALQEVFKLIGISAKQQFKKAQKLPTKKKPKFIITVTDIRSRTLIEKIDGPETVAVGCSAIFKATRAKGAGKKPALNWIVKDAKTDGKMTHYGNAEGDSLTIDCVPETWERSKNIQIIAYTSDPSDGVSVSPRVTSTEVGKYIALVRKAEAAYSSWVGEKILNSLRRLAHYDTANFQKMYHLNNPGNDLTARGVLAKGDIMALREMSQHSPDEGIRGTAKDCFAYEVAMGHVLTGISAGQHRIKDVDLTPWYSLTAGETVDNLYATTVAGDLGQSAVYVNEGYTKKKLPPKYIGAGTEATYPELIGDIDGFLIGKHLTKITDKKSLFKVGSKGIRLSEVLQKYYCGCEKEKNASGIRASTRFQRFSEEDINKLLDQVKRFAVNYAYAKEGKVEGVFTWTGSECEEAVLEFKKWLEMKKRDEVGRK